MPRLVVTLALGARVEVHELDGARVDLGSASDCDLRLRHPSIEPRHARLMARRGRVVLVDLGAARGVRLGARVVRAPVLLDPDASFGVGELRASARVEDGPSWVGTELPLGGAPRAAGLRLRARLPDSEAGLLRLVGALEDGVRVGVRVARAALDPARRDAWLEAAASAPTGPHHARVLGAGLRDGQAWLAESMRPGVPLTALLAAVGRRRVTVPTEAVVALVAQLAEALDARGAPHGDLVPDSVRLGLDGAVEVLLPGPELAADVVTRRPFLSERRRCGAAATADCDRFALAALVRALRLEGVPAAALVAALEGGASWSATAAAARAGAHALGLDPSTGHLARLARLLDLDDAAPLAEVRPTSRFDAASA